MTYSREEHDSLIRAELALFLSKSELEGGWDEVAFSHAEYVPGDMSLTFITKQYRFWHEAFHDRVTEMIEEYETGSIEGQKESRPAASAVG